MITQNFATVSRSVDDPAPANFIEFPYDWRLDNRVHARRLAELVADRLARWRTYSHDPQARVVFLAHSMGGLVARYYLEVLEGWRDCRALVTWGTPYRGSVNAVDFLANGYKKAFVELTDVMRSFPSLHQLLPIYPAVHADGRYRRVAETEVPGVDPVLAADALAFHREIEAKVDEHRADPEYQASGYVVLPIVGTRQPTLQSAVLSRAGLRAVRDLPDGFDPLLADGDGTVPRASAIPIELSTAYHDSFAPERHGSLQSNQAILNDLRGRLEQMQVRGLSAIRGPQVSPAAAERPALSLDLDALYLPGEPVCVRAELVNTAGDPWPLRATIEPVDVVGASGSSTVELAATPTGGELELTDLPPGLYRAEVRTASAGPGAPPPVHELFEIAGAG